MARPILANLGLVLQIAGMLMFLPIILGFYLEETSALIAYFITTMVFFASGFLMNAFSNREEMDLKSSAVLITSVFFVLGLVGSIPYLYLGTFSGQPFDIFTNAFFESISGYTTAGFTLIEDVDQLPKSLLFYRSLTQWVGGIGIVFILLAFFYPGGNTIRGIGRAMGLTKITEGIKLVLSQVMILYTIYLVLFVTIVYLIGFTDFVESVSLFMSSLATGGLSPVSDFSEITHGPLFFFIIIATFLGSLNFFVHDKLIRGKLMGLFKTEFLAYLIVLGVGIVAFFAVSGLSFGDSTFHAVAASSTSGFSSHDVGSMNEMSKMVLMALMFMGGMTFSTAGGLKILRLLMFVKAVPWVMRRLTYGNEDHIKYEGESVYSTDMHLFMMLPGLVMITLFVSMLVFVVHGFSMGDALFESVSSYSLTGFSTGSVDDSSPLTLKWWMMLMFVIGRVEIVAFLVIFTRSVATSKKKSQ